MNVRKLLRRPHLPQDLPIRKYPAWAIDGIRWRLGLKPRRPQLVMRYRLSGQPALPPSPPGIFVRAFEPGDEDVAIALLNANGELGAWDRARFATEQANVVREAFYCAFEGENMVATAAIHDQPFEGEPAWEIGWVARDPAFYGRGLGAYVTTMAVRAACAMPRRTIYLRTDDNRLPAIKLYLALGFTRDARTRLSRKRWRAIAAQLANRARGRAV